MDNPISKIMSEAERAARINAMHEPEQYFKEHADQIRFMQGRQASLVQQWVTVNRRYRGVTISDSIGAFSGDPQLQSFGMWADPLFDDPDEPDVHPINIVRPDIRANTNSCLQANPTIRIEASRKSAELERMAKIAQAIVDHKRRTAWREDQRTRLFDAVQKNSAQFIETYYDHNACGVKAKVGKFTHEITEAEKDTTEPTEPTLNQPSQTNEGQIGMESPAPTEPREEEDVFEYEERDVGDTATRQHLAFNIAIDLVSAAEGGIQTADWLQIHKLKKRSELESEYPHFDFGSPRDWCYALKCLHSLNTNEWDIIFLSSQSGSDGTGFKDFDLFEERTIFLHENAYRNYRFPQDFEFIGLDKNNKSKTKFKARKGQSIAEAQEECWAKWGGNQQGLRLVWVDDRLVDIVPPDEQPVNFRDCITATHWLPVSGTFWSVPHWDIIQMNDDITNLNTFWMEHNGSNVHTTVLFDSEKFDRGDFSYTHVGTKNGGLSMGQKMQDVAMTLQPAQISGDLVAQLQFLLQIKDNISMVQPAQRGEMQRGETYGAQRQQLEQSFGMLTSCVKSFAESLCDWAKHQLKLVQKKWTIEQFEAVAAQFGEVWDEADVKEFAKLDINRDLIIDYQTGTEMPASNFAKEMKFMNIFPILMQFVGSGIIPQGAVLALIKRLADVGDLDIDLTGLEVEDSIAQKRFHKISETCAAAPFETDWATIQQMEGEILQPATEAQTDTMTGQVIAPAQPEVTILDQIVEALLIASEAMPNQTDNTSVHVDFLTRRIKEELASPKTNYLLIACLEEMVANQKDEAIRQQQEAAMEQAAIQMPMAQLAAEAQQGAATKEQQQLAAENGQRQEYEQGAGNNRRQDETHKQLLGLAAQEADREFQSEQMDKQHAHALALEKEKKRSVTRTSK